MKTPLATCVALGFGLCAASAAIEIPIENYSFESPTVPDGFYTVNTIPGWTGEGSWYHVANPTDAIFTGTTDGDSGPSPIDGFNAAAVNNYGHILSQTVTVGLQASYTYTMTVLVGHRIGVPIDDVSVNLVAGGMFLARAFPQPAEGTFTSVTLVYNSLASGDLIGQPFQIELRSAGVIAQGWFDNVHLYAEPSAANATPSPLSPYISIPPDHPDYAAHPAPFPDLVAFGGGGTLDPVPVPEPTTLLAGVLLLLPMLTQLRRRVQGI